MIRRLGFFMGKTSYCLPTLIISRRDFIDFIRRNDTDYSSLRKFRALLGKQSRLPMILILSWESPSDLIVSDCEVYKIPLPSCHLPSSTHLKMHFSKLFPLLSFASLAQAIQFTIAPHRVIYNCSFGDHDLITW